MQSHVKLLHASPGVVKMEMLKQVSEYVDKNREWIIGVLQNLVRIPSVVGEEQKIGEYIEKVLNEIGVHVERQNVEKDRFNVIARLKKPSTGKTLLFCGHMDTVPLSEGWTIDPFGGKIIDGKLYGLGASDMKGGLAAMIATLKTLNDLSIEPNGNVLFVSVVDEEAYSKGILKFLEKNIRADMAVLGEPHFYETLLGYKGKMLVELVVKGRASHGSTPEHGINAINDAAKIITSLDQLNFLRHEKLGQGSLCVLKIEGGYKKYSLTTPEKATIIISRHTVPGETKEKVINDFKQLINLINIRSQVEIKIKPPFYSPYVLSEEEEIVKALMRIYLKVTGRELKIDYGTSVSDANHLVVKGGIPTVVFGPSGGNQHAPNEYVLVDQVLTVSKIYTMLAIELLS